MARSLKKLILPLCTLLLAYGIYQYFRPLPPVVPVSQIAVVPATQDVKLPWPASGQSAIGAVGYGILASHDGDKQVPIASVSKVITALAVLKQKPIDEGDQGPTITLDKTDASYFDYYYARNGSVAKVEAGERISEYQALEAMLIPSANNIADSLARWAFGSQAAYTTYANDMVAQMGLASTKVGEASGFQETTTSTANDLVKLGIIATGNPVLAKIVAQTSAKVPVAGTINNLNSLLGSDGVVGIKTGNNDRAGGCYLFASRQNISGHRVLLVGAVLGQPKLSNAISVSPTILKIAKSGFKQVTAAHKDQNFGYYQTPWGTVTNFHSSKDLSVLAWKGAKISVINQPSSLAAPAQAGTQVGKVTAKNGQQTTGSELILSQDLPGPSFWWRIFR